MMIKRTRLLLSLCCLLVAGLVACSPQVPLSEPPSPTTGAVPLPSVTASLPGSPATSTPGSENLDESPYPAENQVDKGKDFVRGTVEIEESSVVMTQNPPQVELSVAGYLPTPCHMLAWEILPVSRGDIRVEVYSEVDPEVICVQVLEPFDERIELTRLPPGDYTVWVNDDLVDEFHLDTRAGYP